MSITINLNNDGLKLHISGKKHALRQCKRFLLKHSKDEYYILQNAAVVRLDHGANE